ncbi:hypothetical protein HDU84_004764 [Entophlyctis sp. JEL0112]|nr:hypothetical protein HDU84_004764 [Entophlyctis sp. JEL0112]
MSASLASFVAETRALLALAETTQYFGFLNDAAREPVAKQLNTFQNTADELVKIMPGTDGEIGALVRRVCQLVPGSDSPEANNPEWSFSVEKEMVVCFKHALGRVLLKVHKDLEMLFKDPDFKNNNKLDLSDLENLIVELGPIPPDENVPHAENSQPRRRSNRILSFFSSLRPKSAAVDGRDIDDFLKKQSPKKVPTKAAQDSQQKRQVGSSKLEIQRELSCSKLNQSQHPIETSQTSSIPRCKSAGDEKALPEWQCLPSLPLKDDSISASTIFKEKPRLRSKSLVPADTAFLLVTNEPLPCSKSLKCIKDHQTEDLAAHASRASIAAALFGDPNVSILPSPVETSPISKLFPATKQENQVTVEVKMTGAQMKMHLRHSKKKVFEVDLSLWESKSIIKIHDFREEYKRTEIIEISRIPKYPNIFSVAGHTVMLSNLFPLGNIVIESPNKINMLKGLINATPSSKPLFSISGEIKLGRFTIVRLDTELRAQENLGSSSGWAAKRKLKLAGEENLECNLQICGSTWNDVADTCGNADDEISRKQLAEIQNDSVTRHSQLLMAGIALALAPKDLD